MFSVHGASHGQSRAEAECSDPVADRILVPCRVGVDVRGRNLDWGCDAWDTAGCHPRCGHFRASLIVVSEVIVSANRSPNLGRRKPKIEQDPTAAAKILRQTSDAILKARDAMDNLPEFLEVHDRMAFLAIRDCEQELDVLERELDDAIPIAMTQVGERTACELIACLRYITDLERIGDLVWWVAKRKDETRVIIGEKDLNDLRKMISIASEMLRDVHTAFQDEDAESARELIRRDRELDEIRHKLYTKHLKPGKGSGGSTSLEVVFMAQALERAGDHITNLAEELIHLVDGHSVRHAKKRSSAD
jgi:phosphate transport system protein